MVSLRGVYPTGASDCERSWKYSMHCTVKQTYRSINTIKLQKTKQSGFMNEMSELSKSGNKVQVIYAGDAIKHDMAIEVLIWIRF